MLYLIYRTEKDGKIYDCNDGFVIRAKSEKQARKLASEDFADEGKDCWLYSDKSSCEKIKSTGENEIILKDFHAG